MNLKLTYFKALCNELLLLEVVLHSIPLERIRPFEIDEQERNDLFY